MGQFCLTVLSCILIDLHQFQSIARVSFRYHKHQLHLDCLLDDTIPSILLLAQNINNVTMADYTTTKLDPDTHLLLDQPLLRLPNELLRKNFKSAQRSIEQSNKIVTTAVQTSSKQSPAETLASLDATVRKAQNLKRRLEALQTEEKALHRQQKARLQHVQDLHEIPGLTDVKYDRWSQVRLDRLLVDYLLRNGNMASAKELAKEKGIEDLVDIAVFEECGRIEQSLREGKMQEGLAWCAENNKSLKKINVCIIHNHSLYPAYHIMLTLSYRAT